MKITNSKIIIIMLVLTGVLFLQSCYDKSNVLKNGTKNDKTDIIKCINEVYLKLYRHNQSSNFGNACIDTQKVNKEKAVQMGLADAIVGGLTAAASVEAGPIVAAYASLWAGFLASAAMADLYEKSKKKYIAQPKDSSFLFREGALGNAHNDLLEKSITDTNFRNLVISDTLANEVILLFVSNNYFNTNNINLLFNQLQPMLITKYNEFMSNVNLDSLLFNYSNFVINNSSISSIEKSIIITISNQIKMLEPYSYTTYLVEVETLLNEDLTLNNSQKCTLSKFIGILNSSIKFWLIN